MHFCTASEVNFLLFRILDVANLIFCLPVLYLEKNIGCSIDINVFQEVDISVFVYRLYTNITSAFLTFLNDYDAREH